MFWYRLNPGMPVLIPAGLPAAQTATAETSAKWPVSVVYRQTATLKSGAPLHLYVAVDGSQVRNAWATTPTMHNRAHRVSVQGRTLALNVEKEIVTLQFDAAKAEKLDLAKPLTDPIRENWPWWRGPTGRNASEMKDVALVEDAKQAALVWISDELLPTGRGPDTRGKQRRIAGEALMGGWASPVVADNRLFQYYYVPAGTNYSWGVEKLIRDDADRAAYRIHLVDADDVIHCFDARTGRTLWKRVYPLAGLNFASFNKSGPQLTPCIAGNRVFALGNAGSSNALITGPTRCRSRPRSQPHPPSPWTES